MPQTDRVIIHHEGGGKPRDEWDAIDAERYSIEIGLTRIEVRNSPNDSFQTDGTKGPSLQIVLSGNRMNYPVTDNDLELIGEACDVGWQNNWIPAPKDRTCQFHGDTASTACPGDYTRARRQDIYDVVLGKHAPPPEDGEMWSETITLGPGEHGWIGLPNGRGKTGFTTFMDIDGGGLWAAQVLKHNAIGLWGNGGTWELFHAAQDGTAGDVHADAFQIHAHNKSARGMATVTVRGS